MLAYKAFRPDLTCQPDYCCKPYQFVEGQVNITDQANCSANGFHCAENPLDCLSYYSDWDKAVYYLVEAAGDLDEDGWDSKISCTHLTLLKRLTLEVYIQEACKYIIRHPERPYLPREGKITIKTDMGIARAGGAVIVRGRSPKARGQKGSILALLQEEKDSHKIRKGKMIILDGRTYPEDTWLTLEEGKVVKA